MLRPWRILVLATVLFVSSLGFDTSVAVSITPQLRARCLETLRRGLRSDGFWPSMHAAEGLTLAGHGAEVRAALPSRLEREKDSRRRCGLSRELVRAGDRTKTAVMLEILRRNNPYSNVHAAESLFKVGAAGDEALLRAAMARDDKIELRVFAAAALARNGNAEALKVIRRTLAGEDPSGRRLAAFVLVVLGDATDIPQLRRNVATAKDDVDRSYPQHALAKLGDPEGIAALSRNLDHGNPSIRAQAATVVGAGRRTQFTGKLIKLLDDPVLDVRNRAAQSLLVLSGQPVSPP